MSEIVGLVAQHINSKISEGCKEIVKVKPEVNAILWELKKVCELLNDLQGRAVLSNSPDVRSLVKEMGRIAYEAEDEVDTLLFESTAFSFGASKKLRKLKERIIEVKSKLDQHVDWSNVEPMSRACCSRTPEGHIPKDGDQVTGIDHDINTMVDLLIGKSKSSSTSTNGQSRVGRLAIINMGGSGKTTLARSIYNHNAIKTHFDSQAWVSVSRGWDLSVILLDILNQIRAKQRSFFTRFFNDRGLEGLEHKPNMLVSRINNLLNKKTCLLILDDVWDLQTLNEFISLIQGDNFESSTYTIVITSRLTPRCISWYIQQPQCLNDEDSWNLLSKVASNSSKAISIEYRSWAKSELDKCQGLPLAIVALGRQLKTKESVHKWKIEDKEASVIYGPVAKTLGLSYDGLPSYLKPCFLYLGLFQEGLTISRGALIRMWMAEGFIKCRETEGSSNGQETLEDAGRRYLQELIDHSMVQVVRKTYSGSVKTIRIHGIMRDVCLSKARKLDFLTFGQPEAIGTTFRRAAIILSQSRLILPANSSNFRSLALYRQPTDTSTNLTSVCHMVKLLRVLNIFGIQTRDGTLPKEIGNLINLMYLRIRSTNIRHLPKSIGKLRNLLTLDYRDVSVETDIQVPNVLWSLERLRHLYLPDQMSGSVEALKLHTLQNLITLWGVGGGHWMHRGMNRLKSPLSKLYIHRISTEGHLKAVLGCPAMTDIGSLYTLALEWYSFESNVITELRDQNKLQKLKLMGKAPDKLHFEGLKFPSNLGKLELYYTQLERPETMALLGELVSLKVLRLCKDSYMGNEWSCSKGAFPVLEELTLANLPKLLKWELQEGAMPCLKRLLIVSCIKLKQMPEGLKLIQGLQKLDVEHMPLNFVIRLKSVKKRRQDNGGEDFHIIKHIPDVNIRDSY